MAFVTVRVEVNPDLLVWARERSRRDFEELAERFPKLPEWEAGARAPTLRQLQDFANATRTPIGFLLLPEPPEEPLPIPDFRTRGTAAVGRPSADLLDTIFLSQQRQEWYQGFARATNEDPIEVVGSATLETPVAEAATAIRQALRYDIGARGTTWTDAFRTLVDRAEDLGLLVMVSGVVGNNTHRKLDPDEFGGFALVDAVAPVVFVNGADTKAAQIFTLAHELAHIWLGQTALSDRERFVPDAGEGAEQWCNAVAAEVLVPLAAIEPDYQHDPDNLTAELERLARRFKVSTLVVLRRLLDAGKFSEEFYWGAYNEEVERLLGFIAEQQGSGGGDFYNTQPLRVSRRFARAVIASTLEGTTLYRDAFQMLGFKKRSTFDELAERLHGE
jgi:Zn-dependent peptidase ImmA (M78 family)